jgi:protein tyrosine phosphatase (PTP) superfamily phosphohydrolase (DUF442 family)
MSSLASPANPAMTRRSKTPSIERSDAVGTRSARSGSGRVLLIVAIAAAALFVAGGMSYSFNTVPKNFGIVQPGKIYRSGELTVASFHRVVEERGIRTVVDLGAYDKDPAGEERMRRAAQAVGITRFVLPLEGDATGNPNRYVQALRIINDPARQPVLVHCSAGTQRTGCLVMLQRHIVEGKSYHEVFHEAVEHRHDPSDNPHLLLMLADWGDKIEAAYRAGTLIPGVEPVPDPVPTP